MIIARAPLRITLGGGGTDLLPYSREYGGFCISAAICQYIFITVHRTFEPGITVKYSQVEQVKTANELKHPIFREVLASVENPHIEVVSHADIPAGTGLGSSSSFTVALIKAIQAFMLDNHMSPAALAEKACEIEIERLGEPIGRQDQYVAAYGGLRKYEFTQNDIVYVRPVSLDDETLHNLEDGLMLFFTGYSRSASSVLKGQVEQVDNLHQTKEIGLLICRALENGNLSEFAELMDAHWEYKKLRSGNISNPRIDELYATAKRSGALGGKIVGAGGGGFLMLFTRDRQLLRETMLNCGLKEIPVRFDWEGAKIVSQ